MMIGRRLPFGMVATAAALWAAAADGEGAQGEAAVPPPPETISGSAEDGEFVFEACTTCHLPSGSSKTGPDLVGIVRRPAASLADFEYSPALKEAGARGLAWDGASLDRFLAAPKAMVPGTTMNAKPLADPQDRADVIAYLATM